MASTSNIEVPETLDFGDLLFDVDQQLLEDEAQAFADVFVQTLEPADLAKLSTVCRAFWEIGKKANETGRLRLDMKEWEPHGRQGHKPVLNKYKKMKLIPRMVVPRQIPTDPNKPDGPTFLGRVDVPHGSAVNTEQTSVDVALVFAGTNKVIEKLHSQSFFMYDQKKEKHVIRPLEFKLGSTLSRHHSPFGLYQLRIVLTVERTGYTTPETHELYTYKSPTFNIVTADAIPKPGSDRDKALCAAGPKRARFS